MLIFRTSRFSFAPYFSTLFRIGIGIAGAACIALLVAIIYLSDFVHAKPRVETPHGPSWDFRKIDNGLLALRDNFLEDSPSLLRSLSVKAKNSRPDHLYNPTSPQMVLEIKGTPKGSPIAAANGERLFLHWEPIHTGEKMRYGPPAPPNWSSENSCFTLTPFVFQEAQDAGTVFVKIVLRDDEGIPTKEIPFLLEGIQQENSTVDQKEQWLESLRMAKFWTKDLFLELYSNGEAQSGSEIYKIVLETKEGRQILQIREGEYLVYQEGYWKQAPLDEAVKKPLARIYQATHDSLQLQVWDSSGFTSRILSLPQAPCSAIASPIDQEFMSPRLRNSNEVSCLLGKRRVVLKPGDWWLKEEGRGWHCVKRLNEIDDVMAYRYDGELFVIDSLDKMQGRSVLKGSHFDKTRQFMHVISLPVSEGRGTAPTVKPHPLPKSLNKKTIQEPPQSVPIPLARRGEEEQLR